MRHHKRARGTTTGAENAFDAPRAFDAVTRQANLLPRSADRTRYELVVARGITVRARPRTQAYANRCTPPLHEPRLQWSRPPTRGTPDTRGREVFTARVPI